MDVLKGSKKCLENAKYLIVELQHIKYNDGAPLADTTINYLKSQGWDCIDPKFCTNPSGADADYLFKRIN